MLASCLKQKHDLVERVSNNFAAPRNSNKLLLFDPATKHVEGIDVTHVAPGDRLEDKLTWRRGKGLFKSDQALPR